MNNTNFNENTVAIIGLGNVGLSLALNISKFFKNVIGIDTDVDRIHSLKNGKSYLSYISDEDIIQFQNITFTDSYSLISKADIVCFCLPTKSSNTETDTKIFENSFNKAKLFFKEKSLIITESTLPILFHERFIIPSLSNFIIGEDIFVGFCPERINPGKTSDYPQSLSRIFSGVTDKCCEFTYKFYSHFIEKLFKVSNIKTAEFSKVYENTYRAINISFTDEIHRLTRVMEIDIHEVISACKTKGISFEPHYPSAGIGGACIPMAMDYMHALAKEYAVDLTILNSAMKQNDLILNDIVNSIKHFRSILILGASYKKNIADLSNSPTLHVLNKIDLTKSKIHLCDPYFTELAFKDFNINFSSDIKQININTFDVVVLMVDHDQFDIKNIKKYSKTFINPKGL